MRAISHLFVLYIPYRGRLILSPVLLLISTIATLGVARLPTQPGITCIMDVSAKCRMCPEFLCPLII